MNSSFNALIIFIIFILAIVFGADASKSRSQKPATKEDKLSFGSSIKLRKGTNSSANVYTFNRVTKEATNKLKQCSKPPLCDLFRGVYGYALDEYAMIDTKRKVLMEFTPKADCTAAVVAFLDTVGIEKDVDYFIWSHVFRERYYYLDCGVATACMYFDSSWFRFKIVRNPFSRAVSSYLFVMRTPSLREFIPKHLQNVSFAQFIRYQLTLPDYKLQYFATRHAGPQSQYYERFVYSENQKKLASSSKYPPIFHQIVKAEESEEGFNQIYEKTGVRYQFKHSSFQHFQKRNGRINYYVGNVSWDELQASEKIPENYGYFYNEEVKKSAEKLYEWDLLLYNYTFPFEIVR